MLRATRVLDRTGCRCHRGPNTMSHCGTWLSSRRSRPHQRQHLVCNADMPSSSGSDRDPLSDLFKSKVFQSSIVAKDFDEIMRDLTTLSRMSSKFPDFDLAGKRMFLDKMEEASDRYKIFVKRLQLSDDPHAREYLRYTNGQMLNGGFTLETMFAGLTQSLGEYRRWVDEEERVSADPVQHQKFLQEFKQVWSQSALGRINMNYLGNLQNSDVMMKAQRDPNFWKAIKEISDNPRPDVLQKWLDDPNIGPLVAEMWKAMQQQM